MQSNKILNNPSKILTKNQREEYFEEGGVKIDEVLNKAWLDKAKLSVEEFIEKSKNLSSSNDIYDLQKDHTFENPIYL